ncbi:hypothetical protein IQ255_21145 [Pleurocapsales cyanobacterium LEGE 10410]|nr:hypothetical protein [Pleurocapsales cyanobacterium LEGE 10410]
MAAIEPYLSAIACNCCCKCTSPASSRTTRLMFGGNASGVSDSDHRKLMTITCQPCWVRV